MASQIIERDLYNGLYRMVHNPEAKGSSPRYKIMDADNKVILEKPKGVTTIMGAVLAKDFVGWALDCMETELLKKAPTLTAEDIAHAKLESTRRRDSGAGTGSETHALVEHFLRGDLVDIDGATKEAQKAFKAFAEWHEEAKPTVINVEEVIYSQDYKYAGTYDCLLEIDGKVVLGDLKTTNASRKAPNGIYGDYFIQLGAYAAAHEEQRLYEEANGGTNLRPIDDLMVISAKKDGKLDIGTASALGLSVADCGEMWKRVVNLFTFQNYLTKSLGGK